MKSFAPFLIALALVSACATSKNGGQTAIPLEIFPTGLEVTQQDMHPGAQGMVRKIRTWTVKGMADVTSECNLLFLRTDSLQYPIQRLKVNGEMVDGALLSKGEGKAFQFTSTRMFSDGKKANPLGFGQGARILNEQSYQKSGKFLDGTAELVVLSGTDTLEIDLGKIEVLPDVYAP